jgi:amino acid transporter
MTISTPPVPGTTPDKGLKAGALGLTASVVIGTSSAAPAYSLAASLGLVAVVAGERSPGVLLLAFVPMLLIAVAYRELNRAEPDCGTTFTWVTRAFGPWAGWMGGWAIIAADVIVMANLAQIAGSYTFTLAGAHGLAASAGWVTAAGVAWIAVMTYVCYRGIELSARLQFVLLTLELAVLAVFAVVALARVAAGDAPDGSALPSIAWLWPSGLPLGGLVEATLIAVFLYWGWDTAVACNEETAGPSRTPGRAAVLSTLLLVTTYVLVAVAAVAFAGTGSTGVGLGNPEHSGDVLGGLGAAVFGEGGLGAVMQALLVLAVLASAAASTQTTILPTARATLSMAVFRAMPGRFAAVHPRYLTPTTSTLWMGGASIAFYVALTAVSENLLADSIAAVGLMIAFYSGITGFACAWFFRRQLMGSVRAFLVRGVLPVAGGVLLLGAFVKSAWDYADPGYGETSIGGAGGVFAVGIGGLLAGAVLMLVWSAADRSFFRNETLPKGTPESLGLEEPTPR